MKDLVPALRAFLLADSTVAGLVGAGRIYPVKLPQGQKLVSAVVSQISEVGDRHTQGPSGLTQARIQIAAWAEAPPAARTLALAIKSVLDGAKGTFGAGGDSVVVQGAFFENARDQDDTVAGLVGRLMDFIVWFEER